MGFNLNLICLKNYGTMDFVFSLATIISKMKYCSESHTVSFSNVILLITTYLVHKPARAVVSIEQTILYLYLTYTFLSHQFE